MISMTYAGLKQLTIQQCMLQYTVIKGAVMKKIKESMDKLFETTVKIYDNDEIKNMITYISP